MTVGATCFDFSQEVVLKSRVRWQAVRSNVKTDAFGCHCADSFVMADGLNAELGKIVRDRVSRIKARRRSGDKLYLVTTIIYSVV